MATPAHADAALFRGEVWSRTTSRTSEHRVLPRATIPGNYRLPNASIIFSRISRRALFIRTSFRFAALDARVR